MATTEINLGVIGMSEGNGHPYSWSAIFNGYNSDEMMNCPFPIIPEYLGKQNWPVDQISGARVTHIWTQDAEISKSIARASKIPNVVKTICELSEKVDAILLARDDGENHLEMALPFLKAGLPVFVDKPLTLDVESAVRMFQEQQRDGQLFTCSSLRYADELYLTDSEKKLIGRVKHIEAQTPKSWEKYAIHIIEPIVTGNSDRGKLLEVNVVKQNRIIFAFLRWENLTAKISCYNQYNVPIQISYFGEKNYASKIFGDTFAAFKTALSRFIQSIRSQKQIIPIDETLEVIEIIERGRNA